MTLILSSSISGLDEKENNTEQFMTTYDALEGSGFSLRFEYEVPYKIRVGLGLRSINYSKYFYNEKYR